MTHYTVCCGYASHYHNTVTVETDTLDEALEKAIEQAGDDPHWRSVDQASQTFVEALAESMDTDPWGDRTVPDPRGPLTGFTTDDPPAPPGERRTARDVTLTRHSSGDTGPPRPPGGMRGFRRRGIPSDIRPFETSLKNSAGTVNGGPERGPTTTVKWFNPCGSGTWLVSDPIPNTRMSVHSAWLIRASAHPNQGQSVCLN